MTIFPRISFSLSTYYWRQLEFGGREEKSLCELQI
jgi:hypothetical protein